MSNTKEPFKFTEEQMACSDACTDLQRKMVINMVHGNLSQRKAYYKAGGKAKNDESADASAHKMFQKAKVKAFYDSLMEQVAGNSIMSREEALGILSDIGRTSVKDIANFRKVQIGTDEEDRPVFQSVWELKDSDTITDAQARVISEVTAGKDGFKFKTHSQPAAIKQLAQMEGWEAAARHEHTGKDGGPIETKSDTDIDLARKIAFLLTKGDTT